MKIELEDIYQVLTDIKLELIRQGEELDAQDEEDETSDDEGGLEVERKN